MRTAPSAAPNELLRLPFLNGVYVAVDALEGSYLIVDGPYCTFTKAEMQYCHNLRSRLLPQFGYRRVAHTAEVLRREEVQSLSTDRTGLVEKIFDDVCALPDAEIVLATSFDFHELVNFPLREIVRRRARAGARPLLCHVPSRSLGGTWLDGYALTCAALAGAVDLKPARGRKDRVALVGYLRDRDEPDHAGNLRELRRLLAALGLEAVSIWLSGGGRAELERVSSASLVVSMPYAREAAKVVAERVKADLCEVDLPLGLTGTERFLRAIAARVGRRARAEKFIAAESAAAVRDTELHVLKTISGRGAEIRQDDPPLAAALRELCEDLGLVPGAAAPSAPSDKRPLFFASTFGGSPRGVAHVPIGYPNYLEHPVCERPFLGYAGYRHLVDRISEAVLRDETRARAVSA